MNKLRGWAVALVACVMAAEAPGCVGGTNAAPERPPPASARAPAPTHTPACRLAPVDEPRLLAALKRAAERLAGCRGLQTGFASAVHINPSAEVVVSPTGLVIEVIKDASTTQVDADGCIRSTEAPPGVSLRDKLSVGGICVSRSASPSSPARMRCSATALDQLMSISQPESWDLPLIYVLAHELSHIARKHVQGALLPAPATVDLMRSPRARAEEIMSFCNTLAVPDEDSRRLQELQADEDALWVVRIELDDVAAIGPSCPIPPERGGLGEHPSMDIIGDEAMFPPRVQRGRSVESHRLAGEFRTLAGALAESDARYRPPITTWPPLQDPPVREPNRREYARFSSELLCDVLRQPPAPRRFLLPTLPGVTHPDGFLRLAKVTAAIDHIANDRAALDAVIDRQVAAFTTGLVEPLCARALQVQADLPGEVGAQVSCDFLDEEPSAAEVCRPFSAQLHPMAHSPDTLPVTITLQETSGIARLELNAPVLTAASRGGQGVLVGTGTTTGASSAVGLITGPGEVSLTQLPCTPTSMAVDSREAVLFCHEPLAVVRLGQDGRPEAPHQLRKVMLDGFQVDGFIPGLLDRNGQPEDQRMYDPAHPGQIDRYEVPLMRQARFWWANVVDGKTLAGLEFPAGGSAIVAEHGPLGVTVEFSKDGLRPLPLWNTVPGCTDITSSMAISSSGTQWYGSQALSPLAVAWLDVGGARVDKELIPRMLASGEYAEADVPRCTFSPTHQALACMEESGHVFALDHSGARRSLGRFPMEAGELIAEFCSTSSGLYLLSRQQAPAGDRHALHVLNTRAGKAKTLHREQSEHAGLTCNELGAVAFFSWMESALLVHQPAVSAQQAQSRPVRR